MSEIARFRAPGGGEMVILSAEEYQRMVDIVENTADVAAYDRAKRKLASGEEIALPAEFADRLIAGENPVRVWREYRKLTSAALADKAGIGQGFLSQIETGKREGTVETLRKVAEALSVTIDDLVASGGPAVDQRSSIAERIIVAVAKTPGLTEAELAAELFGDKGYQQKVNGDCRLLVNRAQIERRGRGGPADPYRYFAIDPADIDDDE